MTYILMFTASFDITGKTTVWFLLSVPFLSHCVCVRVFPHAYASHHTRQEPPT